MGEFMKQVLMVIIISMFFLSGCAKDSKVTQMAVSAKISALSGDVSVNGIKITTPGKEIIFGDRIIAGDNSFCEIIVNEKNIFKLGAKSAVVYQISDTSNVLLLETGWFAGISRKLFTKNGEYLIKSPTAVASIRGTSFCAKVENPENTYFCVCNGAIDLKGEEGKSAEKVTAAHHAARRFTKAKDGKIITNTNPGMLYHTDAGLEAMSKSIGEKIDWSKPDIH
jgi:hypothetical protein